MQAPIQKTVLTPTEADVWRLCTQFAPRAEGDEDLVIMAEVLGFTPEQVRQAMAHLLEVGLLQRVSAQYGQPVIVIVASSSLFCHADPAQ